MMGAYYAYKTNEGYKVDARCWYKVFEHMIKNNAFAKDSNLAIQDAGIQVNQIYGTERNKKTTRRYMMEEVLNKPYADGYFSNFWSKLMEDGYITPRDGYVDSHCYNFLGKRTDFEMAWGKNGYYLTNDGVRRFLKAYKTATEDKLKAIERAAAKNSQNSNVHNLKEL